MDQMLGAFQQVHLRFCSKPDEGITSVSKQQMHDIMRTQEMRWSKMLTLADVEPLPGMLAIGHHKYVVERAKKELGERLRGGEDSEEDSGEEESFMGATECVAPELSADAAGKLEQFEMKLAELSEQQMREEVFFDFIVETFGKSSAQWIVPEVCRLLPEQSQRVTLVQLHNTQVEQSRPKKSTAVFSAAPAAPPLTAMGSKTATEDEPHLLAL
jgi:hypothetical protein